jgi:bifunctional DNA-binding transcriptional regulator/antitoxin component of YhaV-PrlF toxin-antitoxin module
MGMTEIATDERGRITIPQKTRERFGEHYRLVELENGIKLIPIDDDPLEGLRDAVGDAFADKDAAELKEAARTSATQQINERHRDRSEAEHEQSEE